MPIPTSRGKQKPTAWRKQAVHALQEFPKNIGELTELSYFWPVHDYSAAEWMYRFDQRIARTGIRYVPAFRGQSFIIRVPTSAVAQVSAIVDQIIKR